MLGPVVVRAVLLPAVPGGETGLIMMNTRKLHMPEQAVHKLNQSERRWADGADVAAMCHE